MAGGYRAHMVPLNLGRAVELAAAAHPIAFCQCSENAENLKAELVDIANSITHTRDGEGLEWGGVG